MHPLCNRPVFTPEDEKRLIGAKQSAEEMTGSAGCKHRAIGPHVADRQGTVNFFDGIHVLPLQLYCLADPEPTDCQQTE
jgi:hypothetical protein